MKEILLIAISAVLVNNFVLSQFLGICPFLGVSKKIETALGMGGAVIFVMTLSSCITRAIYDLFLLPNNLEYLNTIVFILVIASLVQFVEVVLKKLLPSLYKALGIYLPLITTNCAVLGRLFLISIKDIMYYIQLYMDYLQELALLGVGFVCRCERKTGVQ